MLSPVTPDEPRRSATHAPGAHDEAARLRAILDAQSELVSQATADGLLVYVNRAYAAHVDRPVEALLGTCLFDYIDPADRGLVRERVAQVLRTGASLTSENRMRLPDGRERWIAWTNARQFDHDGRPLLHSTGRDVTARVHAEQELRTSRAFLARTGQVAGVGGWALDIASGAVTWSEQTRRIHDVGPDYQPTLEGALAFYTPESRPLIERAVQRGMAEGTPWDLELQVVTATGRRIWAHMVGEVELENGRPVRLIGAFQDISERHRLQEQAAVRESFLRQLTDGLPVRIAYLDHERRYGFVNREWCRSTGLERDAVLGRTRAELMPQQFDETLQQRALAALAGEAQRFEFDEVVAGRVRRIENRLIPDRDEHGAVRGFFVTGIDITERSAAEKAAREIAAIFENTPDQVVQTDRDGRVLYVNPAARRAAGLAPEAPVGHLRFDAFHPPATARSYADEILPALERRDAWVGQSTAYAAGRQVVPVSHMVIAHRDTAGRIERYSALMRDMSDTIAAQQEILRQAATLRSVADAITSTVAVLDVSGRYRFVNRSFEQAVGRGAADIIGRGVREVQGEGEYARRRPWLERAFGGERVGFELEQLGPHGRTWLALELVPLQLPSGAVDGVVVVTQDITQRKREESRLQMLTRTDPLTGLLNRTGFEQRMQHQLDENAGEPLTILYVDLDRFKPVNDRHGHAAGDELLRQVARRLTQLVRPSDAVARLGGDEFAILIPGMGDRGQAERVGRQIVEAARRPFVLDAGITVDIGASVGAAMGRASLDDWPQLLARADRMLYQAKQAGRGRFTIDTDSGSSAP